MEVVRFKEGLVVVKNLGGLRHRKGVHLAVTVNFTFFVVTVDKVLDLLLGQTKGFGGAVCTGNNFGGVNVLVQSLNSVSDVVECYVVGIAVSDVGLVTNGDFGLDLVTNVVVATNLLVLDYDVGIELVEFCDILIKYSAQRFAHGVVESDVDFAIIFLAKQVTGGHSEQGENQQSNCQQKG